MKQHKTFKCNYTNRKTVKRIVNQEEIINYISNNPGKTENQIMENIYGYCRGESFESNKKYVDCLRRALYGGKINRVQSPSKRFIYFV